MFYTHSESKNISIKNAEWKLASCISMKNVYQILSEIPVYACFTSKPLGKSAWICITYLWVGFILFIYFFIILHTGEVLRGVSNEPWSCSVRFCAKREPKDDTCVEELTLTTSESTKW